MSTENRSLWLKGPQYPCRFKPSSDKPWRLVLLGPPGVGKGTQAALLHDRLGACHLSTGDIFRSAKDLGPHELSPAMQKAINYMQKGLLVPDEIVIELIRERVDCLKCDAGFVLDGFPRTVQQAHFFDKLLKEQQLKLDAVVLYELDIETIVRRLGGRRVCVDCKAVYHLETMPPKQDNVCDKCGGRLIIRDDDRPEAIRTRMETYQKETEPLIQYYEKAGLLLRVDANGSPEEILDRTVRLLHKRRAR